VWRGNGRKQGKTKTDWGVDNIFYPFIERLKGKEKRELEKELRKVIENTKTKCS